MAFHFSILNLPMEKSNLPPKRQSIFSSSAVPPPPSPIPTARGSRSAADPILSEYVDKSIRIPELKLPPNVHRFKPDEIDYGSIVLREKDSVRRLLRSIRESGVVQISDHGILTEDLRLALGNSDRVFGLTVDSCTSYRNHEKIVWRGDDCGIAAAIGERHYQIFRQETEDVARQLEAIAKELAKVIIVQSGRKQFEEPIELGEPTLSIYRHHQANITHRNSSVIEETNQSSPYALSLHLLLDSTELCLESSWENSSFVAKPNTIVVAIGNELEKWRLGDLKSGEGEIMRKAFVHTGRASFSIEQKWSFSKSKILVGESDKIIDLSDQILILIFCYMVVLRVF